MMKNKKYFSFTLWISVIVVIGFIIGSLTKPEINTWYKIINRSALTPPDYVFPIAWTILYAAIGVSGWAIWNSANFTNLKFIKTLYITQLFLNWMWTPLFFCYHLTALALLVLIAMDLIVGIIIFTTYKRIKIAALLLIPYLFWLLFASYLNFYIWQYN